MASIQEITEALKAQYMQPFLAETRQELSDLQRWRQQAQAMRGIAMSDALHELKDELGRRPTIKEVQKRADEYQSGWAMGIPLNSSRHPGPTFEIRFVRDVAKGDAQ